MTRADLERLAFAVATEVAASVDMEIEDVSAVNRALAEMAETLMPGASEGDQEAVWLRAAELIAECDEVTP